MEGWSDCHKILELFQHFNRVHFYIAVKPPKGSEDKSKVVYYLLTR